MISCIKIQSDAGKLGDAVFFRQIRRLGDAVEGGSSFLLPPPPTSYRCLSLLLILYPVFLGWRWQQQVIAARSFWRSPHPRHLGHWSHHILGTTESGKHSSLWHLSPAGNAVPSLWYLWWKGRGQQARLWEFSEGWGRNWMGNWNSWPNMLLMGNPMGVSRIRLWEQRPNHFPTLRRVRGRRIAHFAKPIPNQAGGKFNPHLKCTSWGLDVGRRK